MRGLHERLVEQPTGNPRLVGDDHHRVAGGCEEPDRLGGSREQLDQLEPPEIPSLFDDGSIAVEKYSRLHGASVRTGGRFSASSTGTTTSSTAIPVMHR